MSDSVDHLATHIEHLERDGYTIVHDAFDTEVAAALHADVLRLERERAIFRRPAPKGGELRLLDETAARASFPGVYDRVRAVTPGTYTHPAATVEDMYRPERHARSATGRLEVTTAK